MPPGMVFREAVQSFHSFSQFCFNIENEIQPDFASKLVKPSDIQ